MKATQFRCPFEVKGIEDKTIIEVALSDVRTERLPKMVEAIKRFHEDHSWTAVRFTLPKSVLEGCSSIGELRHIIVPYQVDFLAVEMDYLLYPFLVYQWGGYTDEEHVTLSEKRPVEAIAAYRLAHAFDSAGMMPKNVGELAMWLEALFRRRLNAGEENPQYEVGSNAHGKTLQVMRMDLSGVGVMLGKGDLGDPEFNRSTFTVVKTPFYPKAFPRYSELVEIVVNRSADVHALSLDAQRRIRRQANEFYRAHGVRIESLDKTQQSTGLWIPDEDYKLI